MAEHPDLRRAQRLGHVEGMRQRIVGWTGGRIEGEVDLAPGWSLARRWPFQHRRDEGRHGDAGRLQLSRDCANLVERHAHQVPCRRRCACRGGARRSRCRTTASRGARVRSHRRSRRGRGGARHVAAAYYVPHSLAKSLATDGDGRRRHSDLRGCRRDRPESPAQVRQSPWPDRGRDRHRQDGDVADAGRGLRGLWRAGLHGRREGRPLGRQPGRRHQSRAPSSAPGSSRSTATRAAPSRRSTGTCSARRAIRCARR